MVETLRTEDENDSEEYQELRENFKYEISE